ncbi:hypothetical protein [Lysinibacillus sp. 54212]|uniref:hypothetical protein n=1 Tax=Lysinibacillus sp. 54212 TaxID=3119829 RepID=UPI002FCB4A40
MSKVYLLVVARDSGIPFPEEKTHLIERKHDATREVAAYLTDPDEELLKVLEVDTSMGILTELEPVIKKGSLELVARENE